MVYMGLHARVFRVIFKHTFILLLLYRDARYLAVVNLPGLRLEEDISLHVRDVVAVVAEYSRQGDVAHPIQLLCNVT